MFKPGDSLAPIKLKCDRDVLVFPQIPGWAGPVDDAASP